MTTYIDLAALHDPTSGIVVPVAWLDGINNNFAYFYAPPTCLLKRSAVQSINDSSNTAISWDTEESDLDGMHAAGDPTKITVPVTGLYLITTSLTFAGDADGFRYLRIYVGGADKAEVWEAGNASGNQLHISTIVSVTAAGYVEIYTQHNAGAALNVGGASYYQSQVAVTLIRQTA